MSEFLATNPSEDRGFPLHHPSVGADVDSGFNVSTAGLTSTLHKELVRVSLTLDPFPTQINICLL